MAPPGNLLPGGPPTPLSCPHPLSVLAAQLNSHQQQVAVMRFQDAPSSGEALSRLPLVSVVGHPLKCSGPLGFLLWERAMSCTPFP